MTFNYKLISCLGMCFGVILLVGCQNTLEGFGKDMQNTGHEIQKSANKDS